MSVTYEQTDNRGTMTLEGDLTLNQAEEMRTALIKAMIDVDDIVVEIRNVQEVDLSCLQLLCSAHRSAVRMNKRVSFSCSWPEPFERVIWKAGYVRTNGCRLDCSNTCLWVKR